MDSENISNDPNKAAVQFIDEMIPHHQTAIEMANEYKSHVQDAELLSIMDNILSSQQKQIDEMTRIKANLQSKSFNVLHAIKSTIFF